MFQSSSASELRSTGWLERILTKRAGYTNLMLLSPGILLNVLWNTKCKTLFKEELLYLSGQHESRSRSWAHQKHYTIQPKLCNMWACIHQLKGEVRRSLENNKSWVYSVLELRPPLVVERTKILISVLVLNKVPHFVLSRKKGWRLAKNRKIPKVASRKSVSKAWLNYTQAPSTSPKSGADQPGTKVLKPSLRTRRPPTPSIWPWV